MKKVAQNQSEKPVAQQSGESHPEEKLAGGPGSQRGCCNGTQEALNRERENIPGHQPPILPDSEDDEL